MSGPLAGVRVLDLTTQGPGPFAGQLLGDMGAQVTHVARPQMVDTGDEALFVPLRNRRSIVVDLKRPGADALLLRLVQSADVLVEGNRPGVMERLGVGPAACLDRNPRLIYARMTGWGQDGPLAARAGHDINYLAVAGALSWFTRRGDRPVPPLNLVADFGGGAMFLVFGIVCALLERAGSGKGQVLDVAMADGVAALLSSLLGLRAQGFWNDEPGTNVIDTGAPYYDVYETADGRHLAVGAIEPQFYRAFLQGLGVDPAGGPEQNDRSRWPKMKDRIGAIVRQRTLDDWVAVFDGTDACVSPVLSLQEAIEHRHNRARGTYTAVDGLVQPAPAPRLSRTPGSVRSNPHRFGADTDEVLCGLGMSPDEIAALRQQGVVA